MSNRQVTRALAVLRLSHTVDGSMSIDAQRTAITRYCKAMGYELVGEALDENISGVVSPFKRPSLGRWLTNKPPRQYDVLVAFHMSRVSRSARDALELVEWLEAHGKTLVTVGDGVNTGAAFGKVIVSILTSIAEAERSATIDRIHASLAERRRKGFISNKVITGYDAVSVGDGKRLVQNDKAHVVREVVQNIISGASANSQGALLSAATGQTWSVTAVLKLLRNPALKGNGTHNGELIRDEFGKPVMFTDDPIIDSATFARLQAALDARKNVRTSPQRASAFNGVVRCTECQRPRITTGASDRRVLQCRTKGCNGGGVLEKVVFEMLRDKVREKYPHDVELYELDRPNLPPDLEERLSELRSREIEINDYLKTLIGERKQYADLADIYDDVLAQYRKSLADVKRDIAELEATARDANKLVKVPMGFTLYEVFPADYKDFKRVDPADVRFALAFVGLSVSVGPSLGRGNIELTRKRVKITELSVSAWKEALNQS